MTRYVLDGRLKAVFLTSAPAALAAPTQAELNAGTDLIGTGAGEGLENIDGFVVQPNIIPTPDYTGLQVGTVAGDQTVPESVLSFYKDTTVETIYNALAADVTGYVVFMMDGQASGEESDVWPITVTSRVRRPGRNVAHIYDVNIAPGSPTLAGTQAV